MLHQILRQTFKRNLIRATLSRVPTLSYPKSLPALRAHHTQVPAPKDVFAPLDTFVNRHNGSEEDQIKEMLSALGVENIETLLYQAIPDSIRSETLSSMDDGFSESELIKRIRYIADQNQLYRSYIGTGYTGTIVPAVIQRNILESPGWYTQYTPYQPEISQGRLESLLNFQTMVADLTGLPIANASLLDEGTAAAEAMALCFDHSRSKKKTFVVDKNCHPQSIACIKTRAEGFGVNVVEVDLSKNDWEAHLGELCGVIFQYPNTQGSIIDYKKIVDKVHEAGAQAVCATDLLALTLLTPPSEFGVDIALGSSQRLGVPMGYGGPHAAFFACTDIHKRRIPGRIIGVSKDAHGNTAYRLSLQTREQHIRREKATSNICTAQALLANMAAMYGVYHGPKGLKAIAQRILNLTAILSAALTQSGIKVLNGTFFDTLTVECNAKEVIERAQSKKINFRHVSDNAVGVTLDETVTRLDLQDIVYCFTGHSESDLLQVANSINVSETQGYKVPENLQRTTPYMEHPVFNSYHSETELLRYIYHLQSKDLSLANSMISLGSCTMKLNATTEMIPVTWPEFGNIHPFVPESQAKGYKLLIDELEKDLAQITGFHSVSLQPNSGAQGEYAGLRVIKAYHESRGEGHRNICLIPVSAHGTNPASAAMAGMKIIPVKCEANGNLDLTDLKAKVEKHSKNLAAIMITYPSTFGVFEDGIIDICELIHKNGGQVYMDGANMNAQVGLTSPGTIGADVCHLNLHKTFCIPHGGGGPGVGPIGVAKHLTPFLPGHPAIQSKAEQIGPISAAPFGSASILPISWAYVKMMGGDGLKKATQLALLNANYMANRLKEHYKILYTNTNGRCAHEFIIDIRPFIQSAGIEAIDIAKRLQDYGFHSPTMSWPVTNTLMIEPTESESKNEMDRFCDALIQIRQEIQSIEDGKYSREDNPLKNAPHTMDILLQDKWDKSYSRNVAAYPMAYLRKSKFWPTVSRLDDTLGDKNLICSCPPMSSYEESTTTTEKEPISATA
ncbi:glycine dehydrogenase [Neoconidiobolus thromboides FSU 785]|nr:glycine dehydrogenase [Neoconidiobolus thromboides FSU 785]